MNKEIEELLNNIKDKYSYEPYDTTGKVYTTISYEEGQLLLSYIEQLQQENQQLKKQKDDVVEYIKNNKYKQYAGRNEFTCEIQYSDYVIKADDLLRMLGEIE